MNNSVSINSAVCIGCGKCAADCVSARISITDGKAEVKEGLCLECGHCFAVCPVNAVEMPGYDVSDCGTVGSMEAFDTDTLLLAMKSRRSIRKFKNATVAEDDIRKILEAGRYSPTGTNMQDVHYTVITDAVSELESHAVSTFRKLKGTAAPFSGYISRFEIDDKFFTKGAPLIILLSGKSKTNVSIASAYMELIAESMGLGVLYSGFFIAAAKFSPKIKKALDTPKGLSPYACLMIGYPDVEYKRLVPRKELKVKYM